MITLANMALHKEFVPKLYQIPGDLVTFTGENLNGNYIFTQYVLEMARPEAVI